MMLTRARQLGARPHVKVGCAKFLATQKAEATAAARAHLIPSNSVKATPSIVARRVLETPSPTPRTRARVTQTYTLLRRHFLFSRVSPT